MPRCGWSTAPAQDRLLALDTLYVDAAMLVLVFGIRTGSNHYFEAARLMTTALSKFLMCGEVIE